MAVRKKIKEVVKQARHPAEIPLTILSALFSIAVYGLITYVLVFGANDSEKLNKALSLFGLKSRGIKLIINIGGPAIILIILFLFFKLCVTCASQIGNLSIKYPRLQDSDFDKAKKIYEKMTADLQLSCPPVVYITDKEKEADTIFGVRLNSSKAFTICEEVIKEAEENDDYSEIEYQFAKNLGDIYLGHYNISVIVFTLVARMIPYIHELIERTLHYSADSFASKVIGKEQVMYSLYSNSFDSDPYPEEDKENNIKNIIKNINEYEKIGRIYENLKSEEPIIVYRLEALYYDKPGKIL